MTFLIDAIKIVIFLRINLISINENERGLKEN